MAIRNVKVISTVGATKEILYIRNLAAFSTTFSGWTGSANTKYKFSITGTPTVSVNLTVDVFKDDVSVGTVTATYTSSDPISWFGNFSYDGISVSLTLARDVAYNDYEEFNVYKYDTLGYQEAYINGSYATEIRVTHAGGTTVVFQDNPPQQWVFVDPFTSAPAGTFVFTASGALTTTTTITTYMNNLNNADNYTVGDLGYYYSTGNGTWFVYEIGVI